MNPPGFDPNKTQVGAPVDNRTQAMSAPPMLGDPNRTAAWTPPSTELEIRILASREAAMANGPAREQFLIEARAPSGDPGLPGVYAQGRRTPMNLCLVIDRSGSMEGEPLEYAKQACAHVVDQLSPEDVLSIVVFDEIVEVLMPPQRVTQREAVKAGIQQLQPGYTTNISDAMTMAAMQLGENMGGGRATRMIFLTDGEPTAGIREFQPLVQHAESLRQRGVTCTFLGFGPDYNEELLASMARKTGGNYYYVPQPHLIPQVFGQELAKVMTAAATDIHLSLKFARWVELKGLTGWTGASGVRTVEVDLADLERGAALQVAVDLEFPNHPLGHYRVGWGQLLWTDSGTGAKKAQDVDLVMEFTADAARYSAPANPEVAAAAQASAASRIVERTIMGLKTQALSPAMAMGELQKTQAMLVTQGRVGEAREVTLAMQAIQKGDVGGAEKTLMGTVVQLDQGKK
jgi:Ca-activated chloride channel family protein